MLKVSEQTKNAYKAYGGHKEIEIRIPDVGVILRNEDVLSQSISLSEAIEKDTNLTFVGCIASVLRFKCADIVHEIKGKYIECNITAQGTETIPLFRGYIDSVTNTSHEQFTMEIVAYDAMKKINEWDVTDWYNSLNFPITLANMRYSFFDYLNRYFPIYQKDDTLTNDMMIVNKTIENKAIKGADIIQKICEINGSPGRVNRYGAFEYVHMTPGTETLYPAVDLYPRYDVFPKVGNENETATKAMYLKIDFENYRVAAITKIQLVEKDGSVVSEISTQSNNQQRVNLDETLLPVDPKEYPELAIYPADDLYPSDGGNSLTISNNPLIWGKTKEELDAVATNLANTVYGIWYVPMDLTCVGLPYVECGDFITASARRSIIYTYVLNRNLKGIQALQDTYISEGDKFQPEYEQDTENRINANEKAIEVETDRAIEEEGKIVYDVAEFGRVTANNFSATNASITNLSGDVIRFRDATFTNLTAINGNITNLNADVASINELSTSKFSAIEGYIGTLSGEFAEFNRAVIKDLEAINLYAKNINANMITTNFIQSGNGVLRVKSVTAATLNTESLNFWNGNDYSDSIQDIIDRRARNIVRSMVKSSALK